MSGQITTHVDGAVGWLVFDHEERRNALTHEMWASLPAAVAKLDTDAAVRVIVMRGAGERAFVSGADISEFEENRVGDTAQAYDDINARAFDALQATVKPLVAWVHGFCVGGGCAIALCADIRLAADDAVFAIPAARLGLGYSASGLATLVRVVGDAAARDLFLTARRLDAHEAHHIGLVQQVWPKAEFEAQAGRRVSQIAANAPLTLKAAKQVFHDLARPEVRREPERAAESIRACYASEDYREGVSAFLAKRTPDFKGR